MTIADCVNRVRAFWLEAFDGQPRFGAGLEAGIIVALVENVSKVVLQAGRCFQGFVDAAAVFGDATAPASGAHVGLKLPFQQVEQDDDEVAREALAFASSHVFEFFNEVGAIELGEVSGVELRDGGLEPEGVVAIVELLGLGGGAGHCFGCDRFGGGRDRVYSRRLGLKGEGSLGCWVMGWALKEIDPTSITHM